MPCIIAPFVRMMSNTKLACEPETWICAGCMVYVVWWFSRYIFPCNAIIYIANPFLCLVNGSAYLTYSFSGCTIRQRIGTSLSIHRLVMVRLMRELHGHRCNSYRAIITQPLISTPRTGIVDWQAQTKQSAAPFLPLLENLDGTGCSIDAHIHPKQPASAIPPFHRGKSHKRFLLLGSAPCTTKYEGPRAQHP